MKSLFAMTIPNLEKYKSEEFVISLNKCWINAVSFILYSVDETNLKFNVFCADSSSQPPKTQVLNPSDKVSP